LVFVSHDTRDADLAEAFDNLLTDASGGMVKTFRSSARRGQAGIEFGAEWFPAIMSELTNATDVVALLTPSSIDRPWILYEAGVAKGKLNTTVFGVALGIPLQKASVGPFAQFQNCADDEESLTKLVLQLIRRNPEASPREAAVAQQVTVFLVAVQALLKTRSIESSPTAQEMDATTVAKLFEEVKVMFRDLPDKLSDQVPGRGLRRRNIHSMMLKDLFLRSLEESETNEGTWLLFASLFRDDAPWFYELAMDLYRALCARDEPRVREAVQRIRSTIRLASRLGFLFEFEEGGDHDLFMFLRHFPDVVERYLPKLERQAVSSTKKARMFVKKKSASPDETKT
jgi:hypothetical protein